MARRSWFFWFLFVGAAFFLFVFTSLYLVARSFRGTPPALGDGSAVAVDLAYEYPEDPQRGRHGRKGSPGRSSTAAR